MGVVTTSAHSMQRAGPALARESPDAELPRDDRRMPRRLVQRIVEHVQSGPHRTLIRGTQGIDLLIGTIGVDHDGRDRTQPE